MLRIATVILLAAVLCTTASAEMFEWTDDRGTVNFTDDLSNVPKKFRKKAKVMGGGEQASPAGSPAAPAAARPQEQAPPAAAPAAKAPSKGNAMYGGKAESAWKAEFDKLDNEIRQIGDLIRDRAPKVENPSGIGRREYLSLQREVKGLQERLNDLKGKLQVLTEEAKKAGVPQSVME